MASYQFIGGAAGDSAGSAVASVGDINGDGVEDFLIGAPYADGGGNNSGAAYLISGADLAALDAADNTTDAVIDLANIGLQNASYQFIGAAAGDNAGISVASAGDVDGDGVNDLLIGAYHADGGGGDSGETYLIAAADLAAADAQDGLIDGVIDLGNVAAQTNSYQFIGTEMLDEAGQSVTSAGDVDGDGKDDLLFGAPRADGGGATSGESYLITAADLAAADAADTVTDGVIDLDNVNEQTASYQFIGVTDNTYAGYSAASMGDIDGDGLDDFVIGSFGGNGSISSGYGGQYAGETYLISGADLAAADAADTTTDGVIDLENIAAQANSYQFVGIAAYDRSGVSVDSAGDVDGDGINDLIIGAYNADGGGTDSGESYLVSMADLAAADAIDGATDGIIDLGNIAVQTNSYQFIGTEAGDYAGFAVSSAGDVDGDGLDDLLIGAFGADGGGVGSGESYLITAADLADADAADGADGVIDLDNIAAQGTSYQFIGGAAGDAAGASVSSAGDIDGDGKADFLIGASGADGGGSGSGEGYLLMGADLATADAADGTTDGVIDLSLANVDAPPSLPSASYQFIGAQAGNSAGISVASAGDVDGDGIDDLIIGSPNSDFFGTTNGVSYVFSGADLAAADAADGITDGVIKLAYAGLNSQSYQIFGAANYEQSGYSVASAGDVDGDGLDDLIIGAYGADGGGAGSGGSYLVSGADLAVANNGSNTKVFNLNLVNTLSNSYQFIGTEAYDYAGSSVASAGDVDGDGLDDLIIGAYGADGGGTYSGEAYLISGADLAAADAADGSVDGVIDLDYVNDQSNSYQFIGTEAGDYAGIRIASAGDVDGDGLDDLIIGAYGADGGGNLSGESYLISGVDLAAADAADGADGVIDLDNIAAQSTSYQFIGAQALDRAGYSVSSAGDVDGDGLDDLIIGAVTSGGGTNSGGSYLISGADLAAADVADGVADGVIDLDYVDQQSNSYQFIGTEAGDYASVSVASAGDVNGDGLDDLIIGAFRADGGGTDSGEAYLISGADLAAADAADGSIDGVIDLDNVNEQSTSYQFIGTEAGDYAGVSVASAGDVDGDGLDDLIIGAYRADGGGTDSGEAYLISGANLAAADAKDGKVDGVIDLDNVKCFVSGTLIATPSGDLPIEALEVGQLVITKDHGPQPIRWIGTSKCEAHAERAPIRFQKGVIGNSRDLWVSPQHRMLVSGWKAEILFGESEVLVAAKSLVNDGSIRNIEGGQVTYVHLMFDQHEIVFSEGAPSESFNPFEADLSTMDEAAQSELLEIFPELAWGCPVENGQAARPTIGGHEAVLLGTYAGSGS